MGADSYEDCPNCDGENTVRIDGMRDYTLYDNGTIETDLCGLCSQCGMKFQVY